MKFFSLKNILKFIVSISLIVFLIYKVDWTKINFSDSNLIIYLTVSVCISLCSLFLMSCRWKLLIEKYLKIYPTIMQLYRYYLIGSCFNVFLPGAIGGDIIRTQKLIKRKVSIKSATIITVVERVVGMYGLLVLLTFSLLFRNFPSQIEFLQNISTYWILLVLIFILSFFSIINVFLKKKQISLSLNFVLKITAISLLAQFGDILVAYILSNYFNLGISFSNFLFIMPLVYIATILPVSLGGLGVREGTFSSLMALYGADISIAIIISFLMYLIKVLVGVIGFFIYVRE